MRPGFQIVRAFLTSNAALEVRKMNSSITGCDFDVFGDIYVSGGATC
ncbi:MULTISPECIES: hypothetical protein [Ruegeria]|nr:hypothetical protein [Ruegeria lacuscaerulensis]